MTSVTIAPYKLELVAGNVDRTTWWKNQDRKEPANVWWLTGGGLNRAATDVEIDLWQRLQKAENARAEAFNACAELMGV